MGVYIPPSIRTIREDIQASVVLTGGLVVSALIGPSNGKSTLKEGFFAELGATDVFTFTGLGAEGPVVTISQIRSKESGGISYKAGEDFIFAAGPQTVDWSAATILRQPFLLSVEEVDGTSSLAVDTFFYVVTALKTTNETGPVTGETVASNELSVEITAANKQGKLTWTTVTGAEKYRIYRSTTSGDFSGTSLLVELTGEFTSEFFDTGTTTTAGSPPGLATFGLLTAANAAPYDLEPAETIVVEIDGGGGQTVTYNATRAARLGSSGTFPTGFSGGETLSLKIDGGSTQIITFTSGDSSLADVVITINSLPLVGGFVQDTGGELEILSDSRGSGSSVEVVGGTAVATLGHTTGTSLGSGNVVDIDAVTAAEIVAQLTAQLTGETAVVDGAGFPTVATATPGTAGSVEVTGGTANTTVGFPTAGAVTGNDATAATALRRPALNGGDFFVDYAFVSTSDFTAKRFTNLGLLIAEHGLGSRLAIGGTLAMGTAGRGNSASIVIAMSVPDDKLISFQTALDFLAKRKDIDLVVPLTVVSGIEDSLKSYCEDQASNTKRRECLGILGVPIGTQVGDATTSGTTIFRARALDSRRAILTFPWPIVDVQEANGDIVETELDGWATAAAVAGRIQSLPDRAEPPTQKQVFGIKKLGIELDDVEENLLGAAGVLVLTDEEGQLKIRDGITTSLDNEADIQININLTDDFLRKTLRQSFRQFRGRKLLPGLLNQIENLTNRVLASFVKFALIATFDPETITAAQDPDRLTFIIVRFTYVPVFPARVIEFRYTLDLSPVALAA